MKKLKVTFGDLSTSLKTVVVFGWILIVLYIIVFILGFIEGVLA